MYSLLDALLSNKVEKMSAKKLFYFGVLPALFFQMLGAALYFLWDSEFSQWIYSATKVALLVWPLFWLKSFRKSVPASKWKAGSGILEGLLSGLFFSAVMIVFFKLGLSPNLGGIQEKAEAFGLLSPGLYIIFAIFFSLIHSGLEEYYWRWFVFNGLQLKFAWLPAAVIGSAAFAGHHFFVLSEFFPFWLTLLLGTGVGLGGFIWCFLYKKYQSLWVPYLSHVLVDAGIMGIGYAILF